MVVQILTSTFVCNCKNVLTDAEKVVAAKTAIRDLNLAWDTNVTTTIAKANEKIADAELPTGVTAVVAEGTVKW